MKRRDFVAMIPALTLVEKTQNKTLELPISSNGYNWQTFYKREGKVWGEHINEDMTYYSQSGLKAYEPSIESPKHAVEIITALKKNDIKMPSIYVNSLLHLESEAPKSIDNFLAIATEVKKYGTKIIVTNPTPLKWGSANQKSDEQLIFQAKMLRKLGTLLKSQGITLAYHTHDMELKGGAREFHHMMQNVEPEFMSFCMDVHWIYRGSDNSQLPIFDLIKMYGNRIIELHIRQSKDGIWQEVFSAEGDIDYNRLVFELNKYKIKPHLVIEQCLEKGSPNTMDVIKAHRIDLQEIKNTFKLN